MRARQERHEALREAAALKAHAKAERDARIRQLVARGWTPAEVRKATGFSHSVVVKAVGESTTLG